MVHSLSLVLPPHTCHTRLMCYTHKHTSIHTGLWACGAHTLTVTHLHKIVGHFEMISFVTPTLSSLPRHPAVLSFSVFCSLSFLLSSLLHSPSIYRVKLFLLLLSSAEILFVPVLCFNSVKQAPCHLSVFPYLQPLCVLQDLSTTQVTGSGCGWGGALSVSNTNSCCRTRQL